MRASIKMPTLDAFARRLRAVVDAGNVSPKRDAAKPPGVENWFRYYAGFSSSFVRSVLNEADLPVSSIVLDPWNGSGTTTHAAASLGMSSLGVDISPVANLVASAKMANAADLAHSDGLTRQIIANARRGTRASDPSKHPLARWVHPVDLSRYLALYESLLRLLGRKGDGTALDPLLAPPPPLASFFLLCLLRAARRHSGVRSSTNPTWMRPPQRRQRLREVGQGGFIDLRATFRSTVAELTSPLCATRGMQTDPGATIILQGDSRSLPLGDHSVDFVLTSPPYCTRLDYPISTGFELAALGMDQQHQLKRLRRESMGTPLIREPGADREHAAWGPSLRALLGRIESHESKNSDTYYLSTYKQYFADAADSLTEIRRVLRPAGKAVLVVQTSYYKEIPIPLPSLYIAMARRLGFKATTAVRIPVEKVLTTINATALRHLSERRYVESVIALEAA